ncbi:hypothetical protein GGI19_003281 [Coemansia pectinata]|uniref:Uncharacterized protein n=1 Tax=Coemansia pectinata TaxID=1052879 RepID=A0A9W8LBE3_9FUNG|nr:hypothetical protein GGI19_003281 [Coemansia pectinata]
MDYRDSEGYFQDDVLRVLGRPTATSQFASTILPEPVYGRLQGANFVDSEEEEEEEEESTSSECSEISAVESEWEEAKRVLYLSLVGVLLPMTFRYIGRRLTFSVWSKSLFSDVSY